MNTIKILARLAPAATSILIVVSEVLLFQFGNVHLG